MLGPKLPEATHPIPGLFAAATLSARPPPPATRPTQPRFGVDRQGWVEIVPSWLFIWEQAL